MGRLEGLTALITGASRGQGEAAARLFVEEGARVAIADVLEEQGRELAHELGDAAAFVPLDVTSEAQWSAAVDDVVGRFGGLDVLVNNAGILHFAPLSQTSLEDYRRVIEVNQVGVFLGMRTSAPAMRDGGSIINVSSVDGLIGMPACVAYCASKFAVCGMTKVAALELAPRRIRVNSIHPGLVQTPMLEHPVLAAAGFDEIILPAIPLGRSATSREIASMAVFLASSEASYATGAEFVVDGGISTGLNLAL